MGYSTDFEGEFKLDKPLHPKIFYFLNKLAETRRMKRKLPEELYGIEGEFYIYGGQSGFSDDGTPDVIDSNAPPSTQPARWLQWITNEKGTAIEWDQGEKFYEYEAWLRYLIDKILAPNGYVMNGEVKWQGESMDDRGLLIVKNNKLKIKELE